MSKEAGKTLTPAQFVLKEIAAFLSDDKPGALCIRGDWGVGKTYAWMRVLKEAAKNDALGLKAYSYVSLFGIENLDQLRYAIFESKLTGDDIAREPDERTVAAGFSTIVTTFGDTAIKAFGGAGASEAVRAASFLSIRRQIVCIDDLERKGEKLRPLDVLGIVSFLKERRDCKVVLILNTEQLDDKEQFTKHQEKVLDISLLYEPNEEECAEIALEGKAPLTAEYTVKLGIRNIRVIRQVQRLIDMVLPHIKSFDEKLTRAVVQTVVLYGWAHYTLSKDEQKRFLAFANERLAHLIKSDDENLTPEQEAWNEMLESYEFGYADELDEVLLLGIRNGYFDIDRVKRAAGNLEPRVKQQTANAELDAAWRLYHDSLDDNEDEVIASIEVAMRKHVQHVTPSTLSAYVGLLKRLDRNNDAKAALDFYMKERNEDAEFYNLSHYSYMGSVKDPDVVKAFGERLEKLGKPREPNAVLARMAAQGTWQQNDIPVVMPLTVEEITKVIRSLKGSDIRGITEVAALMLSQGQGDPNLKEFAERIYKALKHIAAGSKINRSRMGKLGIVPD
jgi:hypothetical protein